jgi:8-oxo-dGTP diphosphatase
MRKRILATDIIIESAGKVVLVKRAGKPSKGSWCLPGGHVEYKERIEDAATREAKEETGLNIKLLHILGVYSDPNRDPRGGHAITTVFIAKPLSKIPKPGDDAEEAKWIKLEGLPLKDLAFDHGKILKDYVKSTATPLVRDQRHPLRYDGIIAVVSSDKYNLSEKFRISLIFMNLTSRIPSAYSATDQSQTDGILQYKMEKN